MVICAGAETHADAVQRVATMWQATGAIIHRMSAVEHDDVFAAVSHLPHLLAFALVGLVMWVSAVISNDRFASWKVAPVAKSTCARIDRSLLNCSERGTRATRGAPRARPRSAPPRRRAACGNRTLG